MSDESMEKLPHAAARIGIGLSTAGDYCRRGDWPGAVQRGVYGEWWVPEGSEPIRRPNARKVGPDEWREILRRMDAGERATALADEFGLKPGSIYSRKSREKAGMR